MKISTFDTTLRDGTQGESISFSVEDKLIIAQKLDELGIDYIEGGWPGSNPKDKEFFARARDLTLNHAKLTAFGATRFAKNPVEEDRNVRALVEAGATHVQGCMNGYGERCGNANLASILANLELKLGHTTIGPEKLASLTSVCRFLAELANLPLRNDQAFVGKSAFAHKGGVHV